MPCRDGTSTARQAPVPVWCSTSGRPELSGAMATPTAQRFAGPAAATPASAALPLGLGTTCQPAGAAVTAPAAGAIAATARNAPPTSDALVLVRMAIPPNPGRAPDPPP